MKNPKILIKHDGLSSADKEYQQNLRREIDDRLSEFSLAYANCKCDTCRVSVINRMEDVVNAELFYWNDTLQAPLRAGEDVEMDAFDNSLNHIVELHELIDKLNTIRRILLNQQP